QSAQAQRIEAEAKLAADDATYQRLKTAAATPGVVAGNDVDVASKTVDADRARVEAWRKNEQGAADAAKAIQQMDSYPQFTAHFHALTTERLAHEGALVSPRSRPMLRLQEAARLRVVFALPEAEIAGVKVGHTVHFSVPAFPGEMFPGRIQRIGHA